MKAGFRGTFVISWSQTDVDGLETAPMEALEVGTTWSWHGDPVRVDGPDDVLRLDGATGEAELRRRAARKVRRLVGAAVQQTNDLDSVVVDEPLMDSCFIVTNGAQSYTVTVIDVAGSARPLLMFHDEIPPRNTNLWIVHLALRGAVRRPEENRSTGVICFTPGTRIDTPEGAKQVETLREGDLVSTEDSGPQEIQWVGSRRMTGARLFVMPSLRPIRFRAGALGIERPDQELLVSPDHRMLVRGAAAKTLFNTTEVLVPARDLVNGSSIRVDLSVREVTYIHLLLPNHHIVRANGVETESFHPASARLSTLTDADRVRLLQRFPDLESDPHTYGGYARRTLSASETAILMHDAA